MEEKPKITMGGQALIEGVMMKAGRDIAMVVRKPNGEFAKKKYTLRKYRFSWMSWPFIRGIFNLIEMLFIGMKGLVWSANQVVVDEEEEEFSTGELVFLVATSMFFAILFFVAVPYFLTGFLGVKESVNPVYFNLVDGVIKIIFFLLYIISISFMHDVKRLFEYHGAEHMAVYCYEDGKDLTVENVRAYSTCHPRCGTAFIMIVFITSVFIFALIPLLVIKLFPNFINLATLWQKLILFPVRIMFIPLIAGISYEILRLSARYHKNLLSQLLVFPGIMLQKLTTRQPDPKQIDVAIRSLKLVVGEE